jgi:hypothetical protein
MIGVMTVIMVMVLFMLLVLLVMAGRPTTWHESAGPRFWHCRQAS